MPDIGFAEGYDPPQFRSPIYGGVWHEAAKIDKLRKEMTKPEQQIPLQLLEGYAAHIPKLDPLLPWIAREMKKGRLVHGPDEREGPLGALRSSDGYRVTMPELRHMADWYADQRAPNRRGLDIMQYSYPEIGEKVHEYDKWLQEQATDPQVHDAENAPIAHQYPDGWTLRQLRPQDLEYEGNCMGHCVGGMGYGREVENGNKLIYSLRDPKHVPHVTMEMEPTEWEPGERTREIINGMPVENTVGPPVPQNAQIIQIQGKGNNIPKPEYQERIKQWMETMPENERPYWEGGEVTDPRELIGPENGREYEGAQGGYGPHGDYGVGIKDEPYWPSILDNNLGEGGYRRQMHRVDPDDIYLAALKRKEIPQLAEALEKQSQEEQDNFDEWRHMNHDQIVDYPMGDEEYPLELPNGEVVETPEEHEKAYDEDYDSWMAEHPGMSQVSNLYKALRPHLGVDINGSPAYVNTIQPDPTAYVRAQEPNRSIWAYWQHPAQRMWEAGEVPEHPVRAASSPSQQVQ